MYRSKAPISKYRRVVKQSEPAKNNEIRIKVSNPAFSYVAYAAKLFLDDQERLVFLNSTGPATSNAVKVVEQLRRGIKSMYFIDEWKRPY